MAPDELMQRLGGLRRAQIGEQRAPHKPLLLLWLFGRFATTGSALATYAEAADPVSQLLNDFGPPVKSPALERQRAAMPFVHLERDLWELRDGEGVDIGPDAPDRGRWLLDHGAVGELRPEVTILLADSTTLAAATRLLLDQHEEVLRAYAYRCAMCGFDGRLGHNPVAIEAAHVRWHSQTGPDELANAVALCSLHHALFDCGVLGLSTDLRVTVSPLYVATSQAGSAVDALAGQPLLDVRPGQPSVDVIYVNWHAVQVFKRHGHRAA